MFGTGRAVEEDEENALRRLFQRGTQRFGPALAEIGLVLIIQHVVNIKKCDPDDRRMELRLRPAFNEARQRLAALPVEQ